MADIPPISVLESLIPAEYKGVSFLVNGASIIGGLKSVKHEYPNSANQVIETLGPMVRTFRLEAVITGDGKTYYQKRNELIRVLESEGSGNLKHPLYGSVSNVIATTFNLSESFNNLGRANFSITFELDYGIGTPQQSITDLVPVVKKGSETVTKAGASDFLARYSLFGVSALDVKDAIQKGRDCVDQIQEQADRFSRVTDQINYFTGELSAMSGDIVRLVQTPVDFFDSVNGLISAIPNLFTSVEASFEVLFGLFDFGDDDIDLPDTTYSYQARTNNRTQVNTMMQVLALSNAYYTATQIAIKTVPQSETLELKLETQFQKIYDSPNVSTETKLALQELRNSSQDNFDLQRSPKGSNLSKAPLAQTTKIYSFETSSRLLAFTYYGSALEGEDISLLNRHKDSSFIQGTLEIFTQ